MSSPETGTVAAPADQARRHYDLIDAGRIDGMLQLFTEDVTYLRPGYEPMAGVAEMARFYRSRRRIREGRHRLELVGVAGDEVIVRGAFNGVLHDETLITLRFTDFFEVGPDGRFTRRETFFFAPLV